MNKFRIYFRSSSTGLVSTFLTKISSFFSVWILNQLLSKQGYGNYEFAHSIISIILILGSAGLQHIVMYRISRLDVPAETLAGRDLAGRLLRYSLITSGVVCLSVIFTTPYIAAEDHSFWIIGLSFLIPIRTVHGIYEAWFRSRQLIPEAIIYHQLLPSIAKVAFLFLTWISISNIYFVVFAILLSELVPLVYRYYKTPLNIFQFNDSVSITSWDFKYAGRLTLTTGVSQTVKYSDILMMGLLATSKATAEYVISSKLALLLIIAHQINNTIITPRIGKFLEKKDYNSIIEEYNESRVLTFSFAIVGAIFFLFFGVYVLEIFGEYSNSHSVLLILTATYLVSVSFGMSGNYLNIAGYSELTLLTTVLVLIINVFFNYLLIPLMGADGAALAMLISFLVTNAITSLMILHKDNIATFSVKLFLTVSALVSVLLLNAFSMLELNYSAFIIIAVFLMYLSSERRFLKRLTKSLINHLGIK